MFLQESPYGSEKMIGTVDPSLKVEYAEYPLTHNQFFSENP